MITQLVPVTFRFPCGVAPRAHRVTILGPFNSWDPRVHHLTKTPEGDWVIKIDLPPDGLKLMAVGDIHIKRSDPFSIFGGTIYEFGTSFDFKNDRLLIGGPAAGTPVPLRSPDVLSDFPGVSVAG